MFFEDQPKFLEYLDNDLNLFRNFCLENNLQGFVRLNGTSDLNFINLIVRDNKDIFQLYPEIQFYDYTKIYDRETSSIVYGRVPKGSVVVPGSLPSSNGAYGLSCAVIVKKVDRKTLSKVGPNELLRRA